MATTTYLEAIRQGMLEEMRKDPSVFLIGEDIGVYGGAFKVTEGLLDEFGPDRVIDTPISETAIVGAAIGASFVGMRPVAELMTMNFGIVAMDQIVNHASKMRYMFGGQVTLPLVIRAPGGGGTQKAAQHSHCIESWFVNTPGIRVVIPATPYDVKGLLKTSIRSDDPILFIEHEMLYSTKGEVPEEEYLLPLGVAQAQVSTDISIAPAQEITRDPATLETELVLQALCMALSRRKAPMLHHSDRGSQYASDDYKDLLALHGIEGSMSRKGNCYDNAAQESFYHTLKTEHVFHEHYRNLAEARSSLFDYIEIFYNRQRSHTSIGYKSPTEFEEGLAA